MIDKSLITYTLSTIPCLPVTVSHHLTFLITAQFLYSSWTKNYSVFCWQQIITYFIVILKDKKPELLPKKSCKMQQTGKPIHAKGNFFLLVWSLSSQINSWSWFQIVCYECRTTSFSNNEGVKQVKLRTIYLNNAELFVSFHHP